MSFIPIPGDDEDDGGGGGGVAEPPDLLASVYYNPAVQADRTVASTTSAVLDGTNITVTFTAPASGVVIIKGSASTYCLGSIGWVQMCLRDASAEITGSIQGVGYCQSHIHASRPNYSFKESGLTPGVSYTRKLALRSSSASQTIVSEWGGATAGAAWMEVWSA